MLPLAFGFAGQDAVIIAVVVLLLFGGSKLAGFGKSLGQGIKEFKNATSDDDKTLPPPTTSASPIATTPPVVASGVPTEEK